MLFDSRIRSQLESKNDGKGMAYPSNSLPGRFASFSSFSSLQHYVFQALVHGINMHANVKLLTLFNGCPTQVVGDSCPRQIFLKPATPKPQPLWLKINKARSKTLGETRFHKKLANEQWSRQIPP